MWNRWFTMCPIVVKSLFHRDNQPKLGHVWFSTHPNQLFPHIGKFYCGFLRIMALLYRILRFRPHAAQLPCRLYEPVTIPMFYLNIYSSITLELFTKQISQWQITWNGTKCAFLITMQMIETFFIIIQYLLDLFEKNFLV